MNVTKLFSNQPWKKFLLPRTTNLSSHLQLLQEKDCRDFIISHDGAFAYWVSSYIGTKKNCFVSYKDWLEMCVAILFSIIPGKDYETLSIHTTAHLLWKFWSFQRKPKACCMASHVASICVWNWYFWKKSSLNLI